MSYKIIGDSCMDLPEELKNNKNISLVPLTLIIDDKNIIDDETFDQKDFLERIKKSHKSPGSACPSPNDFMKEFDFDGDIYVITLSSELSGSHNSAVLAKNMYLEDHPDKNIEVFDSKSASISQTLIGIKIMELAEKGLEFNEIVKEVNKYREGQTTKFVLETLEILRKNGRLTGLQAIIASALNIKPVMGATKEGTIFKIDQARGINRALDLMVQKMKDDVTNPEERIVGIAHCNNHERALFVKEKILSLLNFKDCLIVETGGVSSLYAADGGIIVAY